MTATETRAFPASVRVRVPGTSANLGPGFDALGLALSLYDEAIITLRADAKVLFDVSGLGADSLPRDESHLLLRSMRTAAQHFGLAVTGVEIWMHNVIPQGRGLGSSAATISAAVAAAWMLRHPERDLLDRAAILAEAAEIEGHPDNVAACVYGGLTISWQGSRGAAAARVAVNAEIKPVLFEPTYEMATSLARGLLPPTVSHADAAFTAGRSALLIHALSTAPHLLLDATEDRLHQPYRAKAMPDSALLCGQLRQAGVPAVISGAGPSVLALCGAQGHLEAAMDAPLAAGWLRRRLDIGVGLEASLVLE